MIILKLSYPDIVISVIIALSLFLTFLRLSKGPTSADRVVALDVLTTITVVLLVFLSFIFKRFIYLDVALVYAIISFVGSLVLARYLEGGL